MTHLDVESDWGGNDVGNCSVGGHLISGADLEFSMILFHLKYSLCNSGLSEQVHETF